MSTINVSSVTNNTHKISHQILTNPGRRNGWHCEPVRLLITWISDIKPVDGQDGEKSRPDLQLTIKDSVIAVQITAISFKSFINEISKQLTDVSWLVIRWKKEKRYCSLDLHGPSLDTDVFLATSAALEGPKKLSDYRGSAGILLELQIG